MEEGNQSRTRRERTPQASDDEDEVVIYCSFPEHGCHYDKPRHPRPDYSKPRKFVQGRTLFEEPGKDMAEVLERAHAWAKRRRQRQAAAAAEGIVKRPKITLRRVEVGTPDPRSLRSSQDQPSAL